MRPRTSLKTLALLALLTALAIGVHGYHLGIEDQDVYLAAVKRDLNPALYPHNSAFFTVQMRGTAFDKLMALTVWATGLPVDWVMFGWHALTIFAVLLGGWRIARRCFTTRTAASAAVVTLAALLTLPVAGTALYVVDQYLHPRAMATAAILFAIAAALERRYWATALWLLGAVLMHPLMAVFGVSYTVFLLWRAPAGLWAAGVPLLGTPSPQWRQAAQARDYYFLARWRWYEWLGIVAPLALTWWFARLGRQHGLLLLSHMCRRLLWFGVFQFGVAAFVSLAPGLEQVAAFQPMRWMHLYYVLFFLFAGGLTGEFLLEGRRLRWALLYVPLFAGTGLAQRRLFPDSAHIEIHSATTNQWSAAFNWIRGHTPVNAYFAINPDYMNLRGEDNHGFRALAERSLLAENCKDPGAATVFPALLGPWFEQSEALRGWTQFSAADFRRLHERFGADWVVLERDVADLECPYRNAAVRVCRIP